MSDTWYRDPLDLPPYEDGSGQLWRIDGDGWPEDLQYEALWATVSMDLVDSYEKVLADEFTVVKTPVACLPISDEMAMEYGLIPDTRPPYVPPRWRTRLRWRIADLRERAAVNLYRLAAGHDIEPRNDD